MMIQGKLLGTVEISEVVQASLLVENGNVLSGNYPRREGVPFNEWRLIVRERERYQAVMALYDQCEACVAEKKWALGIKLAQYWLEIDPIFEKPLRYLMHFLANDGRPGEALRRYERYRWWLSAELAIEPENRTRILAQKIAVQANLPFPQ